MSTDFAPFADWFLDDDSPMVDYAKRAAFYEVEYHTTADQQFLRSLVTEQVGSVLEIPCGAGRNLDWLHDTGREVVCADLEPAMVERVSTRIRELDAQTRMNVVVADIREFDLGRRFDLVLVPQEAFQLLSDRADAEAALRRLAAHLDRDGTLLLDLHRFDGVDHQRELPDYFDPTVAEGVTVVEWTRPAGEGRWLTRARRHHDQGEIVQIGYHYRLHYRNRTLGQWKSEISVRRYEMADIYELAAKAGLTVRQVVRNYDGQPYDPLAGRIITMLSPNNDYESAEES